MEHIKQKNLNCTYSCRDVLQIIFNFIEILIKCSWEKKGKKIKFYSHSKSVSSDPSTVAVCRIYQRNNIYLCKWKPPVHHIQISVQQYNYRNIQI
jgi:hypothetical protein